MEKKESHHRLSELTGSTSLALTLRGTAPSLRTTRVQEHALQLSDIALHVDYHLYLQGIRLVGTRVGQIRDLGMGG